MIKINIDDKKEEIISNHEKAFGKNYKKVRDKIKSLSEYNNFYSWFQNKDGIIDTAKIKRLLCTDSKKGLINLIAEIEPLIECDSKLLNVTVKEIKKNIEKIFDNLFTNFSRNHFAYDFLKLIDATVCPYCNRSYTFTIVKKIKPELDHYFPKSKYPYLAISIFNIIPCCSSCNKGKSNNYVDKQKQLILYPYEESFDNKIIFKTDFNELDAWFDKSKELTISLYGDNNQSEIIKAYNDAFKIDDLYTQHADYAREIIKKAIILDEEFFDSIYYSCNELFDSPDEVKQTFYSNYLEPSEAGKRSLSKLTQDLLNEYNINIYDEYTR